MAEEFKENDLCIKAAESKTVNQALRSEAMGIFNENLKPDFSTKILDSVAINKEEKSNSNIIPDVEWLNEYSKKLLANNSPIILEYHKSEIENVNSIIKTIVGFVKIISIATLVLVTLFVLLDKDAGAIIAAILGGVIDVILGSLVGLFNSTLKSKKSYFDSENDSAKFDKMLLLVQTVNDQEKRDTVIVDIIHKYFDVSNGK